MRKVLAILPLLWMVGCSGCADVKNDIGEGVGYIEMTGLRFPVKKYHEDVSGTQLTRGSRVDSELGYEKLHAAGFDAIIDLREEKPQDEDLGAAHAGLEVFNVPVIDNTALADGQCETLVYLAGTTPKGKRRYIHCQEGRGRTGEAVACIRTQMQCWPAAKALAEMETVAFRYGSMDLVQAQKDYVLSLKPPEGCEPVQEEPAP